MKEAIEKLQELFVKHLPSSTFRHRACYNARTVENRGLKIVETHGAAVSKLMATSEKFETNIPFQQLLDDFILERDDDLSSKKEKRNLKTRYKKFWSEPARI